MDILSRHPQDTVCCGERLALLLAPGDVLCLEGTLGSGKTCLVQGIARGLHVKDDVSSPTFALMHRYEGDRVIYHFDLYRLDHADELEDINFYATVELDGVSIIEWANKFPEELPEQRLVIRIDRTENDERLLRFIPYGTRYEQLMREMNGSCGC